MSSCGALTRSIPVSVLIGVTSLTAGAALARAQDHSPYPVTARVVQDLVGPTDTPLFMPTDVAVTSDGAVFVVDGVHDRIVHFDPDGEVHSTLMQTDGEALLSPVSVTVDKDDRLWITDAGHHHVLVYGPNGADVIELPATPDGRAADPTDIALDPDGTHAWIADNDNHRLLRFDRASRTFAVFGRRGQSLSQYHYPFMLATNAGGDVLITDVLNGRVQILDRRGVPVGTISSYGADLGQVYRPKGVAIDALGQVWISDGTLNIIQVFTLDGRLVDVLRDADGKVLKFASPMGLTFDAEGALYVVELLEHRVRKLAIQRDPQAAPPTRIARRRAADAGPQARSCTVCHFEWLRPLSEGQPTELVDVPPNPAEHPWVSRSTMCLGCHDASVGDSRHTVWVAHGHRIGVEPPDGMHVPDTLPLVDNQIMCRTCHSAHTGGEPGGDIAEVFFLRVEDEPHELCFSCHTDKLGGVAAGAHPLGEMPWELPQELIDAGATSARDATQLTCQGCHTAHGAPYDQLMFMSTARNELCLACHEQMPPGAFPDHETTQHSLQPFMPLTPAGGAAVAALNTNGMVVCLSCHNMHAAQPMANLLHRDIDRHAMCTSCHADMQTVLKTTHNLRESMPQATNRLGVTVAEGGTCSACHMFHRGAREPVVTELDPAGQCVTCHQTGGLAAAATLTDHNHPDAGCTDCHDPHVDEYASFFAVPPAERCTSCHTEQAGVVRGPHQLDIDNKEWPSASRATKDACLACHRPHAPSADALMRVVTTEHALDIDSDCLACHPDADPSHTSKLTFLHPRELKQFETTTQPHPVHVDASGTRMVCESCHDPHRDGSAEYLLRVASGHSGEDLCLECHTERVNVHAIGHAEESLRRFGFDVGSCRPCHVMHGDPASVERDVLWPESLSKFDGADQVPVSDLHCRACHRTEGPVAPPSIATHPDADMYNPDQPGDEGYLPLFNARGEVYAAGTIGCRTCHLTHGRKTAAPVPSGMTNMATRELRARQWHVRTFSATNVCTTCHGFDGVRRYMYFHDAARRGGPIEGGR